MNDSWVEPKTGPGTPALDFIRGELGLTGTKEGCREGDCGACAVLVGEFAIDGCCAAGGLGNSGEGNGDCGVSAGAPRYLALPSCLLSLGDLAGKHLITIEGLSASAPEGLTPVMRAFLEENASQCGFCSPGFVVSLSAWLAGPGRPDLAGAMIAADGNLCRCTGYGAIRRAAERLAREFGELPRDPTERLKALAAKSVLPRSVLVFMAESRLVIGAETKVSADDAPDVADLPETTDSPDVADSLEAAASPETTDSLEAADLVALGGGTDYYVRNPYPAGDFRPLRLRSSDDLKKIARTILAASPWIRIGAAVTLRDFFASTPLREAVPGIETYEGQFASTLIRNIATVGGNIANASPVGDITSMLMALGAKLEIGGYAGAAAGAAAGPAAGSRLIPIEDFFTGYKTTALRKNEIIRAVLIPDGRDLDRSGGQSGDKSGGPGARPVLLFSFEKIAKREKLDIAAVNTAISFRVEEGFARGVRISAGGVAAVPTLLRKASAALEGAAIDRKDTKALARLAREVGAAAEAEISPIGDVRGSASYRKRMTGRLMLAHFIRLFGADGIAKELFP